ncbi:MAG: YfhO family protein [Chloroflexi bacterium]|nr:YfhO family protein [Chloroflexota bacterium]
MDYLAPEWVSLFHDLPHCGSAMIDRDRPRTRWLPDALALCTLCLLIVMSFWSLVGQGRVLAAGDIFTYFYPYWAAATRALRAGRLPLWNPHIFTGAPFLANSQVGLLYPVNWLLWMLLPPHWSVHATIVVHVCLAALNAYAWGRSSLGLRPLGAWATGFAYALGGYLGAQVEHVNQLQGLAWFPLTLVLADIAARHMPRRITRRGALATAGLITVVGFILAAGHLQTAFICVLGLAFYLTVVPLWNAVREGSWPVVVLRVGFVGVVTLAGVALAAAQLAPTIELSRLSIRADGLPFNERLSFSLSPLYVGRMLLPGFFSPVPPVHLEHVAYIGMSGIALVAFAAGRLRGASANVLSSAAMVVLGLSLSLGLYNPVYVLLARFVPGFAHFRVPARWLTLFAMGAAGLIGWALDRMPELCTALSTRFVVGTAVGLAAIEGWAGVGIAMGDGVPVPWRALLAWSGALVSVVGLLALSRRWPRVAGAGLIGLLIVELYCGGLTLPRAQATAAQAFTSLRPAIAHILAGGPGRFLSMSDITFDPGDLPEIEIIYGPQLSDEALYDYVIATKRKEVLDPNMSMVFGVSGVDGYDGGLLPLAHYTALQRLLLPHDEISLDGRLRETMHTIPEGRWLNLLGVRYIVTDKLRDAWLDDVFYDLQFGARLSEGEAVEVAWVPEFRATAIGLVSHLQGSVSLPDGTSVGVIVVRYSDGTEHALDLRVGVDTAEGIYDSSVEHSQAPVGGHYWPGCLEGNDYVTRLHWNGPATPSSVRVQATVPEGELVVRGLSLIDERTGAFQSLVISDQGRFRLAHSGDVKIYENLDALPRAFVATAVAVADDEEALALMRETTFDPVRHVVLMADGRVARDQSEAYSSNLADVGGTARIVRDEPERVEIAVSLRSPGYLVLADAWYPGWEARVDGDVVPIERADLLFRAVAMDSGEHMVVFSYEPVSLRVGGAISLVAILLTAVSTAAVALLKVRCNVIMSASVRGIPKEG